MRPANPKNSGKWNPREKADNGEQTLSLLYVPAAGETLHLEKEIYGSAMLQKFSIEECVIYVTTENRPATEEDKQE